MTRTGRLLTAFWMVANGLWGQVAAPPPLVHLYPVALGSKGQPVTDLTAADFKIADQGKSQTIFLFRRPSVNGSALEPQEYTNRRAGVTPHSIAILFDLLNSSEANRVDTWHSVAKSIPLLESAEQVYFYVLNLAGELVAIHPIGLSGAGDGRAWLSTFEKDLDKVIRSADLARPAGIDREDRTKRTYHQLEVISNQLATLPGRRDIIWITSAVPTVTNSFPCGGGDWVDCGLYVPHMAVTLGDHGVRVNPDYSSGTPQPTTSYDLEQVALLTGGHTYYHEDIREVAKEVALNASNTYEIAYAPSPESWDNKFHKVRIECERKGVKLQVKARYYALPDARTDGERQKDALEACNQKASDSAEIGLRVRVSPASKGIHIEIRVDTADLLMREQHGKFSDALTLVVSDLGESTGTGLLRRPVRDPSVSNLNLDLSKEQYETMMIEGVRIAFDHALSDEVQQVRAIVMDRGTNEVGSVTFPVR